VFGLSLYLLTVIGVALGFDRLLAPQRFHRKAVRAEKVNEKTTELTGPVTGEA
jgi:hypothetical protein